jgi:hypothetical protein
MWQGTQRVAYKHGTLSQERINKLLETPGWEWRAKAYRWEEHTQHMITHYDTLLQTPSKKSNNPEEKQADVWQDMLRTTYTHETLSQDHVNELKGNPEWEWGVQREITYTWEEQRQHWITQYEKLLDTPSTKSKDPEEKRAGIWQSTQRTVYKHGTLSQERINKLLETPGWEWGVEIYGWEEQRNNWVTVYTKIQKYPSQISKDPEEKRAGIWQSIQRAAYKKGTLTQERINKLEVTHGWEWGREKTYIWEEQKQTWITQYNKLQKTPSTKSKETDEKRAGEWQSTQRKAKKQGTLSPERVAELEAIPGWTWSVK